MCVCVCVCVCIIVKAWGKKLKDAWQIGSGWLQKNQECIIIGVSIEIIALSQNCFFFFNLTVNFWLFEDGYVNVTSCNLKTKTITTIIYNWPGNSTVKLPDIWSFLEHMLKGCFNVLWREFFLSNSFNWIHPKSICWEMYKGNLEY